ncbi:hypothetical protein MLD38_029935 [Melastoma candidum]|uniref:Uncharacterized protein n=1 Tax=Melastoma candidum TaxID=119954 RepID=A0ACB9MM80_9MYRT|nr:hypothetical protein MLD38_029935 [Melastoma candidum]
MSINSFLLLIIFTIPVTLSMAGKDPSSSNDPVTAAALPVTSVGRKLGQIQSVLPRTFSAPTPSPSLEEAIRSYTFDWNAIQNTITTQPRNSHPLHHRNVDKSMAGGGIILGGLLVTFLFALFCYIRATCSAGSTN